MSRILSYILILLTITLAACGGGGGSAGSNVLNPGASGSTTTTTVAAPVVTDFQLGFNKNSLNNSGGDEVILNVIAVDQNNNVARGETVQVSVDSQGVFNASTTVTDGDGKFTGKITSPINKTNRTITVTARMGAIVKTATLN
ncbi:MAG: Ig-like domain-containing protein [Brachymonas sp.]